MEKILEKKQTILKKKEEKTESFLEGIKEEYHKITWLKPLDVLKQMKIVLISGTTLTIFIALLDVGVKYLVNLFL